MARAYQIDRSRPTSADGALSALEEEMMAPGAEIGGEGRGGHSPDRADALVWALSHLLLGQGEGPRIRVL